jgi:hypothetical protein
MGDLIIEIGMHAKLVVASFVVKQPPIYTGSANYGSILL